MTTIPQQPRRAQLILFDECPVLPQWHDLAEPTRLEAVRLLTQLLVSVQRSHPHDLLPIQGEGDE
jgi:hypothetical protein